MQRNAFQVVNSDEWWFERLHKAMHETKIRQDGVRRSRIEWYDILWSWFESNPPLPEHATEWQRQITQDIMRMGRTSFAHLSTVSVLDRVNLLGFRTMDESEEDQTLSRQLMKSSGAAIDLAITKAAVMSEAYIWVGEPDKLTGLPIVTAEDPRSCVTINHPITGKTVAALKLYRNDVDGHDYAHIAIADTDFARDENGQPVLVGEEKVSVGARIRVARRKSNSRKLASLTPDAWEWVDEKSGELPIQGRGVMVHRIEAPFGLGDFEPHLDVLRRIWNMIVDRLWISKFQVFRQRAIQDENTDPDADDPFPDEDEDGNEIDWDKELAADPGAMWRLPAGTKIWESTPTDLQSALLAVRDDIKEYAADSRTPLYVFTPDAVGGSAEGAGLAREQQVYKAENYQTVTSPSIARAIADMRAVAGSEEPDAELDLLWMPAERFSLQQKTQGASQAKAAGVPWEGVMEDFLQASPDQIARYRRWRNKDLLFGGDQVTGTEDVDDGADAATAS